ncbi:hypothetical protein HK105_204247 [Polyrhizophydium stewartii]|uniref:Uncharacterized protein n=1 Tax=Polyrhizophydium stewartii TaxID=2732419 RepID=A0ABR4N9M1_9FUNG
MQVEELREALAAAQDSEIQRCAIAAQDQRREHYNRIGPALIRRALLHSVHTQESMRAKLIAGQCRERLGSSVPTVEVAPQPLARVNRLTARRSGLRYDKTSIHREYVVVRCDQPARDDASPAKTVRHAAAVESRRRAEEIRARQTTLEALAKNATTRHEKAIESIQMDKKRNKMIKELDQLDLDDRRRKQVNAGLYANRFRPDYIRMGPNELNSRFVQQFGVGKLFWLQ